MFYYILFILFIKINGEIYNNWMENNKNYLYKKTLLNIVIPGTHDSGIFIIFI